MLGAALDRLCLLTQNPAAGDWSYKLQLHKYKHVRQPANYANS